MKHLEETIKLLNQIQKKPASTQRELVEQLDISLGKVNFLIRSLTERGLVKLARFKNTKNKKAYLYILTPSGAKIKYKLLQQYLENKIDDYNKLKVQIGLLKEEVANSWEDNES